MRREEIACDDMSAGLREIVEHAGIASRIKAGYDPKKYTTAEKVDIELAMRKGRAAQFQDTYVHAEDIAMWREDPVMMYAMSARVRRGAEEMTAGGWLVNVNSPFYDAEANQVQRC